MATLHLLSLLALSLALAAGCGQTTDESGASAGATDTTFGDNGVVSAQEPAAYDRATALAIQSDGRTVVAGTSSTTPGRFIVRRFLQNGEPDTAFGAEGRVAIAVSTLDADPAAVAVQADGRIVVAGRAAMSAQQLDNDLVVARLERQGALDATFGDKGLARLPAGTNDWGTDVALQADGKIVVTGSVSHGTDHDLLVARFDAAGALDSAFGAGGVVAVPLRSSPAESYAAQGDAVAVSADGRITVAATARRVYQTYSEAEATLVRLDAGGGLDATFSGDGVAWLGGGVLLRDVVALPDGKAVVAGGTTAFDGDFWLGRYDATGSADASFGAGGSVRTSFGTGADTALSLARDPEGRLVAAGQAWDAASYVVALARYTANGSPDADFGAAGHLTRRVGAQDAANAVAVHPDGRILLAGESRLPGEPPQSRMLLLRYLP